MKVSELINLLYEYSISNEDDPVFYIKASED